jgi:prevent-host-death family protein
MFMDAFTVRDLRERTGELIRDAETGELSVVTKHGRPVFIAVPFDEKVMKSGVSTALAVKLYQEDVLSLGKASKFAGCSVAEFTECLGEAGIPIVRYSAEELDEELAAIGGIEKSIDRC